MLKKITPILLFVLSCAPAFCQKFGADFIGLSEEEIINSMKINVNYTYIDKFRQSERISYVLKYELHLENYKAYVFFVINQATYRCTSVIAFMPNDFLHKSVEDFNKNLIVVSKDKWTDYFFDYEIKRESPAGSFMYTVKERDLQF